MTIAEALQVIDASWADLAPQMTVRQLTAVANLPQRPLESTPELAEALFGLLAPALPREHPAWAAVRHTGTRFSPGVRTLPPEAEEKLVRRFVSRARREMSRPSIVDDAAADFLLEATEQQVLRSGIITLEPIIEDLRLIGAQIGGRWVYPLFQFASLEPLELHPVVGRLHEQLGGFDDDLGAIMWWLTPNTWLGRAPGDLLGSGHDPEIEYAANQLTNDSW